MRASFAHWEVELTEEMENMLSRFDCIVLGSKNDTDREVGYPSGLVSILIKVIRSKSVRLSYLEGGLVENHTMSR